MSIIQLPTAPHELPAGAGHHLVQFYEADQYLVEIVTTYLVEGITSGEPVVVIATEEHRRAFAANVASRGVDPARIRFFDARTLIGEFMDGPAPDGERFLSRIGGILEQALAGGSHSRLRAYGEMVDLLWRGGNHEAAVRVEELWNDLGTLYPFTLLCAYPMGNFSRESDSVLFEHICRAHGHVFPAESFSAGASSDTRLREVAALQQRASALQAEVERRRSLEQALDDAVAARRKAEEQVRAKLAENARLYELAQQTDRTKDQFLTTLSHELRTPLTSILGWARMLNEGSMDEKTVRMAVETIERSAQTQASLIDDLLDLSRIVTGKMVLRSEPVDLARVVHDAVASIRLAADARTIRVDVRETAQPCVVIGDPTRLRQIAWHLLSNAVKFSRSGTSVAVEIDRDGNDDVRLTVRDHGCGIPEAFLPHVFEPFRQADGATTRTHEGLGLGLAVVKYLVEAHGGTVTAGSPGVGEGATFTVTLPLAVRRAAR